MDEAGTVCAVCRAPFGALEELAEHFVAAAASSDIGHVMWLNRNVTKYQVDAAELAALFRRDAAGRWSGADRVRR